MSRIAPYQWICLRAIQPRLQRRTLATDTSRPADSNPTPQSSTPPPPPPPTSTSDLKSYLQSQDTAFLKATKQHLSTIHATAQTIADLSTTLPTTASKIQILATLPAYTTYAFRASYLNPSLPCRHLLGKISILNHNLTDLEYTPYPSATGPSKVEKFKKKLSEWTHEEKVEHLGELRAVEVSHAGRLTRSTEGLKGHVEKLEALGRRGRGRGRRENPFGGREEEPNGGEDASKEAAGFGAGGTDLKPSSGEEGMMPNPFMSRVKEREKKAAAAAAAAKTAKPKEKTAAVDESKDAQKAPTQVADAVQVPKPPVRKSLADHQAALNRSLEEKK